MAKSFDCLIYRQSTWPKSGYLLFLLFLLHSSSSSSSSFSSSSSSNFPPLLSHSPPSIFLLFIFLPYLIFLFLISRSTSLTIRLLSISTLLFPTSTTSTGSQPILIHTSFTQHRHYYRRNRQLQQLQFSSFSISSSCSSDSSLVNVVRRRY